MHELYGAINELRKESKLDSCPNPVLQKFISKGDGQWKQPSRKTPKKSEAEMIQEFFDKGNTITVIPEENGDYYEKRLNIHNFMGILS